MDTTDCCDHPRQATDGETSSSESTRALKSCYNSLTPVSRLPSEILAAIFAFLPPSAWNKEAIQLAWICITHVCHLWRETALNYPLLWSHINFTKLAPASMAELLARAKLAPLYLEADISEFSTPRLDAFEKHLEAHISHTRHLSISGDLESPLKRLVSSAPILEHLSLSHEYSLPCSNPVIPVNVFSSTAPRLTSLELEFCDISWKSPLLKGLQTLKILVPSIEVRPNLEDWLDALNKMTQLETLILQSATPIDPLDTPLIPEPPRAVTLPSLANFHISTFAKDCAFALAHLVLPALTWLRVDVESLELDGEDVRLVIPYIARNVYAVQGKVPLRSILISGKKTRAEVLAWITPDADIEVVDPNTLLGASVSARLVFSATGSNWEYGVDTAILDALLALLPVNSISTLSARDHTRASKEFWLSHAPRLPLLRQARLVPTAVRAFRDMLAEDAPPDGPRLPSLTKLILVDVAFTTVRTYFLRDMLIERVEQGVPLETLDLCTCVAADRTIELLMEIVVDVQGPLAAGQTTMEEPSFSHSNGRIGHCTEVEYDDELSFWHDEMEYDGASTDFDDSDSDDHDFDSDSDSDSDDHDSDSDYDEY